RLHANHTKCVTAGGYREGTRSGAERRQSERCDGRAPAEIPTSFILDAGPRRPHGTRGSWQSREAHRMKFVPGTYEAHIGLFKAWEAGESATVIINDTRPFRRIAE